MTLAVAFFAGLVSCVSPCVLPVIPVFASYVAGGVAMPAVAMAGGPVTAGSPAWRAWGFLVGFLGVFVLLWASVGVVGFALLSTVPVLRQLTGALIVLMGIAIVAGRHPALSVPTGVANARRGGPVVLGAGVAVGWTPCIGPTLGAILALSATTTTVGSGFVLLLAYAAGLAVPFLIVLVAVARYRRMAAFVQRHRRGVDVTSGLLTAGVGVLVFTGAFARLAGVFSFGIV